MLETSLECPNCHKGDKVEKVSAIVEDGFSTTPQTDAEPFEWVGKTYYIHYKNRESTGIRPVSRTKDKAASYNWNVTPRARITVSPLANRLLPQIEKPDAPPTFFSKLGCFSILFWPLKSFSSRISNWAYRNMMADYSQKLRKSLEAQRKWSRLFYCYRCEGIFSEQTDFMPAGRLNNYLFDLELNRWAKPKEQKR